MKHNNLLGLPDTSINLLSGAVLFFVGCLGIRVIRASDLALKVANTQLVTSNSADRLENLAQKLEQQALVIEQKDEAYQELQDTYEQYLKNRITTEDVDQAVKKAGNLPKVEDINQIRVEILETEEELLEITEE